ncbi:MAG: helix-hairpin-helix domain-containing protein [Ilumatobacteraceae bacterium]
MEPLRRLFVWWGWQRVVAAVFGVPLAVFAVWWMVRAPAPPVESQIPYAPATSAAPDVGRAALATPDVGALLTPVALPTPVASLTIVVHVVGAVAEPGVYELPVGARGDDAVRAAGGLTSQADVRAVNLALQLGDGEQLVIPRKGETLSPAGSRSPSGVSAPRLVNINRASVAELDQLPGVGQSTARAIVEHRERHGPYATVDDLLAVRGIGPAKLAEMRAMVSVS